MISTKRLTTGYKLAGTESFRRASSKLLGFYGTNLQNPSSSLMSCVMPSRGRFVQPDQSGAEALVVAMECRKGKFRALFDYGIKPHSYMALQIFTEKFRGEHSPDRYKGVDPMVLKDYPELKALLNTIKDSEDEYFLGKKTIHAYNYDEGVQTFRISCLEESEGRIVLSFKDSKTFKGIWQSTFPEISEWHAITWGNLAGSKDSLGCYTMRNLFGYPRVFGRLWNDELKRQALAFLPQSTVGIITALAFTEISRRIRRERLPWDLINDKHDSILVDVPDTTEHTEMCMAYCKEHMGRELVSSRGEHYRMKVGISLGYNWAKSSKSNPDGMKEL
jgi:hypothetical protein